MNLNKSLLILLLVITGLTAGRYAFASPYDNSLTAFPPETQLPLKVGATILLADMQDINTAKQVMTAKLYTMLVWHDSRLAHSNETPIKMKLSDIWHPNLQIVNLQRSSNTLSAEVFVESDGTVRYLQGMWGEYSQKMDLRAFPFDTQRFSFNLVTAGHTSQQLVFYWLEDMGGIADELSVSDWDLLDLEAEAYTYRPVANAKGNPAIRFSFEAIRRHSYFVIQVIFPLIMIVIMSWVVFWLDPKETGSNVGVCMTSMLTLIAYRFSVASKLPNLSYLTTLDYFVMASSLLVFSSFIEVVYATHMTKIGRHAHALRIDKFCRLLFPLVFSLIVIETLYLKLLT